MSTKDEKHTFEVTEIDWADPNANTSLPREMTVTIDAYYPDYTSPIREKLREYANASVWPSFTFREIEAAS